MENFEQELPESEGDDEATLSELGDYLTQLEDYEAWLARGEILWQ